MNREQNKEVKISFKEWGLQVGSYRLETSNTAVIVPLTSIKQLEFDNLLDTHSAADLFEVRADLIWDTTDVDSLLWQIARLRSQTAHPLILTFRSEQEGGENKLEVADLLTIWEQVICNRFCDAIDIEYALYEAQKERFSELMVLCKKYAVRTIFSHHTFDKSYSSETVCHLLTTMKEAGCDLPKIACMVEDQSAALEVVRGGFEAALQLEQGVIAIGMGRYGRITRLAGHDFGQPATFAAATPLNLSAPGQLPADSIKAFLGNSPLSEQQ